MVKVSIITVCFNARKKIEATIKSVLEQDYSNLEYVIIDGASTDGTIELVEEYATKDNRIKLISEKDSGLYEAMNKGLKLSEGQLIEFLNAGDEFISSKTVSRIAKRYEIEAQIDGAKDTEEDNNDKIIIYGDIIYMNSDGSEDKRLYGKACGKAIYYATGDCVNHQAIFASRQCFTGKGNDFDENSLRICADRDWMMRQTKAGAKWIAIGETVVKYQLDEKSISAADKKRLRMEERICMKRHYPLLYPIYLIFDGMRRGRISSKILHAIYKVLYIRK